MEPGEIGINIEPFLENYIIVHYEGRRFNRQEVSCSELIPYSEIESEVEGFCLRNNKDNINLKSLVSGKYTNLSAGLIKPYLSEHRENRVPGCIKIAKEEGYKF